MIKSLASLLLKRAGYKITRVPRQPSIQQTTSGTKKDQLVNKIVEDPLNGDLHLQYSLEASNSGKPFLAYAELKTAEYLGADRGQVAKHAAAFRAALPELKKMNHNQYFRFETLASEIIKLGGKSNLSVLDVGGDQGQLSSFIPADYTYCLVEPTMNGLSGKKLPFHYHSFDYVVSCHVLEHIPVKDRLLFLDQLLSKSKHGVILLNPFHVEGTHIAERLKLFYEITGAQWAKEHLECTLPKVDELRSYAADRGLRFHAKPNGTMTTSMAFVFVDHLAGRAGDFKQLQKINAFFNEKFIDILDSAEYPNAYLVYLGWPEVKKNPSE
ncbi:MAG: methyltransferase domain-containing protein [Nitrospinota bacterium]